ncbi:MAG: hypothetical protein UZ16_OP3001000685 [Candidatus Hinthialibacteria bacterium OLB16]|nr:MAG: hypothetical protein UZ16_OP3001000685 [Candidatus Hinthialibacteria bacterium OLB16]
MSGTSKIDIILKDDVHTRETEHRVRADILDTRNTQHGHCKGIGDLVFHILGRSPLPVGEDYLLVFSNVRNGIHWNRIGRETLRIPFEWHDIKAPSGKQDDCQHDDQRVVHAEPDHPVHQGFTLRERKMSGWGQIVAHSFTPRAG